MLSALLALVVLAADAPPADAVIVAPRDFLPALQPLIDHRTRQGHRFLHIPNTGSAADIRAAIRRVAASGELKYVLIVGDAEPAARTSGNVAVRCVPTHQHPAKVNVKWGSESTIASDNWYADLDDDHLPDLAIGRLAADTPAELSQIVAKILAYERSTDFGPWRQRVNLIAGVGGFSPLVDTVIETATSKLLTSGIPATYDTRMTYGSWRSPYCPDPRLFHAMAVERHNEGCLFWVYIGHGQAQALDQVAIPGERFHIFDVNDCRELKATGHAPIAIMLACYTAAFDQQRDCLSEEMLRSPGGPVAVYGGSRVTMPYAMGVMGTALMNEFFSRQHATLGATILAAKRRSMAAVDETNALENVNRLVLDAAASLISPSRELEEERREHLHLFNLLGDPMLRIAYPEEIALTSPRTALPGETLKITGHSGLAGKGVLELVCRRDYTKQPPPIRERFDPTDKALASFQPVYEQSLDRCYARWALELPGGDFTTEITIPTDSRGPCHLRLLATNQTTHALGAANLHILPPEPLSTATAPSSTAR